MMTKEEWKKKYPKIPFPEVKKYEYVPGVHEGDVSMGMTHAEKTSAISDMRNKEAKQTEEYKKHRKIALQTPEQEEFNNDPDF